MSTKKTASTKTSTKTSTKKSMQQSFMNSLLNQELPNIIETEIPLPPSIVTKKNPLN